MSSDSLGTRIPQALDAARARLAEVGPQCREDRESGDCKRCALRRAIERDIATLERHLTLDCCTVLMNGGGRKMAAVVCPEVAPLLDEYAETCNSCGWPMEGWAHDSAAPSTHRGRTS